MAQWLRALTGLAEDMGSIPSTHMTAVERQRQVDLCEFKASLVYIPSSRPAGSKGRPYLKKTKKKMLWGLERWLSN